MLLRIYLILVLASLCSEPSGITIQPILQPPIIINDTSDCSNIDQLLHSLTQSITSLINESVSTNLSCLLNLGSSAQCAADSCHAIAQALPNNPSGYYWILNSSNAAVNVYCDLVRYLNGSRGWMRVAYVNMSDSNQTCPSAWTLYTPTTGVRLCGRPRGPGCFSVNYTTYGVPYSKVCGWVKGYNYNTNDGFNRVSCASPCPYTAIDQPYVDGVSITRNSPSRKHLWSYACGGGTCPCNVNSAYTAPSFVESDWYCQGQGGGNTSNYYNYPLWGGACSGSQAPCCTNPNRPWFYKTLSTKILDNLEVRICADQSITDEDTRLQNVELYTT
ncbi:hypothetical protein EMCRGX_G020956 [Ephydatia muelleri]